MPWVQGPHAFAPRGGVRGNACRHRSRENKDGMWGGHTASHLSPPPCLSGESGSLSLTLTRLQTRSPVTYRAAWGSQIPRANLTAQDLAQQVLIHGRD